MKPQTKHCLHAIFIIVILLGILIKLDDRTDGISVSMWAIIGLIIIATMYAFISGAMAIAPERKRNVSGPHIRRMPEDSPAELPYVEMEDGTWRKK